MPQNVTQKKLLLYKQQLKKKVSSLLTTLHNLRQTSSDNLNNEQLKQVLNSISEHAKKGIERLSRDLHFFENHVEWDTFNIAFFGETNAGKSTLIESLIRGDGKSIGEGYKDHTKRIRRYSLKNINLLDMPGIEGTEKRFVNEIKKAVNMAHVVIYVLGQKEPEEGTLAKIKSYLKDKVKVISVINLRGTPSLYSLKPEKVLIDDNAKKIEENTIKKFKSILSENYHGNIMLNAYIAFLSTGNPLREDFKVQRRKAEEVFDNLQEAYHFSGIEALEKKIMELYHTSKYDIAISNTYKVLTSIERILSIIFREKKDFDTTLKTVMSQLDQTFDDGKRLLEKYKKEINQYVEGQIGSLRIELNRVISRGIDEKWGKERLKKNIKKVKNKYQENINLTIQNKTKKLEEELNTRFKELKKRISLYSQFINLKGEFDLEAILNKMEISFNYFLEQVVDVGLSVLSAIGAFAIHPILGIISLMWRVIRKIWEWFFGDPAKRKREAKNKAHREINAEIDKVKRAINSAWEKKFRELNFKLKRIELSLKAYKNRLKSISRSIDDILMEIKSIKAGMSAELVKFISEKDVKLAYIDLELSKMLIIGEPRDIDPKLFRVKEVLHYESFESLCNSYNIKRSEDIRFVDDEFIRRAFPIIKQFTTQV